VGALWQPSFINAGFDEVRDGFDGAAESEVSRPVPVASAAAPVAARKLLRFTVPPVELFLRRRHAT